jgi:hypothetical protein
MAASPEIIADFDPVTSRESEGVSGITRHCEEGLAWGPTLMDETNTAVIARLDRATQYSRGV